MGWTFVFEHNKDVVVVRYCNNINTSKVEYTKTNNMVELDGFFLIGIDSIQG